MTKRGRFDSKSENNPFAVCPYVRDNSEILNVSMKNQKINITGKENTRTTMFNVLRFPFLLQCSNIRILKEYKRSFLFLK